MWANKVSSCWKSVCRVRFHVARCCPLSRCVCLRPGLIWLESVTWRCAICNLWPFDLKERKHFRGIMTLQITDVKKLIFTPVIFMIIARHNYGLSCFSWEPWPGCPDWLLWPERRTKPGPGTLRCRDQECGEMRRRRERGRVGGWGAWCKSWYSPARADDYTDNEASVAEYCSHLFNGQLHFTMLWAKGKL